MADLKISELIPSTGVTGNEKVPVCNPDNITQSAVGSSERVTIDAITAYIISQLPAGTNTFLSALSLDASDMLTATLSDSSTVTVDLSTLSVDINVDNFTYDSGTQTITLTETDGTTHPISVSDLVDITNLSIANVTDSTLDIESSTGSNITLTSATETEAGLMSAQDKKDLRCALNDPCEQVRIMEDFLYPIDEIIPDGSTSSPYGLYGMEFAPTSNSNVSGNVSVTNVGGYGVLRLSNDGTGSNTFDIKTDYHQTLSVGRLNDVCVKVRMAFGDDDAVFDPSKLGHFHIGLIQQGSNFASSHDLIGIRLESGTELVAEADTSFNPTLVFNTPTDKLMHTYEVKRTFTGNTDTVTVPGLTLYEFKIDFILDGTLVATNTLFDTDSSIAVLPGFHLEMDNINGTGYMDIDYIYAKISGLNR